jgi:hypothetical protein
MTILEFIGPALIVSGIVLAVFVVLAALIMIGASMQDRREDGER